MVGMSAKCEYIGGTRGSGLMSSANDVLKMGVVRGMRVGWVCEMCMCLARCGVGGEAVSG